MMKIGAVLAIAIGVGFFAFPQARPAIAGLAPFALFAACPIAMLFAMRGMNKSHNNHNGCASCEHNEIAANRADKNIN